MKQKHSTTLRAAAVAVASVIGCLGVVGSANAAIAGDNSVPFTTTINVTSDNTCTLTVTPPASAAFTAAWTGNVASGTSTINVTNSNTPPYIKVAAAGGTTCSLNAIKLETSAGTTVIKSRPAVAFGSNGGYWTYGPALADAKFYTDAEWKTAGTGTITALVGDGSSRTVRATVTQAQGVTGNSGTLGTYITMTDGYVGTAGNATLTDTTTTGTTSFQSSSTTEKYKSAEFGIGVALSVNPVDQTGVVDKALAANGDVVTMPFTVTVTEA
ncbi:hypothetical protein [Enterobacter asburiae]|uniref:hypothetical protein n=1 Tax=Enterobacter asburiae TaxID=61645 RepID=UPI0021D14F85|nr:hypothetical protein [Enterobacter asburiae]MCU6244217.1 hypothetical protein [Enterobacter asburiae]